MNFFKKMGKKPTNQDKESLTPHEVREVNRKQVELTEKELISFSKTVDNFGLEKHEKSKISSILSKKGLNLTPEKLDLLLSIYFYNHTYTSFDTKTIKKTRFFSINNRGRSIAAKYMEEDKKNQAYEILKEQYSVFFRGRTSISITADQLFSQIRISKGFSFKFEDTPILIQRWFNLGLITVHKKNDNVMNSPLENIALNITPEAIKWLVANLPENESFDSLPDQYSGYTESRERLKRKIEENNAEKNKSFLIK
ncbi:hypothetical protein [Carboxylicivirga caseinilyticus]|uniref:hypothetical protein n=1 Tax=Carboxylicivirga caseinilyticus TaxID=3417572 RepID=UPI003D35768E|nr:hypothetical protein [Marinilabiliaceae bacterium A049]